MTNKLHCPFCGAELDCVRTLGGRAEYWMCQNTKSCPAEDFVGNKEIWQALIDGKAAQDALNDVVDEIDRALYANHYDDKAGVRKILKDLRASIPTEKDK